MTLPQGHWGEEEARRRIARAVRRGETVLRLDDLDLEHVPAEVRDVPRLRVLSLRGNLLEELPGWLTELADLEALDLAYNELTSLPPTLSRLAKLRILRLDAADLYELPESARTLTELRVLSITDTEITSPPAWLAELPQLRELHLGNLGLTEVPAWIERMPRLTGLDLSENVLRELPDWIARLPRLRRLWLSQNCLRELPDAVGELRELSLLDLRENQLADPPEAVTRLTRLRTLKLNKNRLRELPEDLGELPELRQLEVGGNDLVRLPSSLANLTRLRRLGIGNCPYDDELEWIGTFAGLRRLDISGCGLDALPYWLRGLRHLSDLTLSNNSISELPDWIGELTSLRQLVAAELPIRDLPASLGDLPRLFSVVLDSCALDGFPSALLNLRSLVLLSLVRCGLRELPAEPGRLTRLESISVGSNDLDHLPDWPRRQPRLKYLEAQNNELTGIPESLRGHARLRALYLMDNPMAELPEWVGALPRLKDLGYSSTTGTLPEWLRTRSRLQYLWVTDAALAELPEWIGELRHLETLGLLDCPISTLPDSVAGLRRLGFLNITRTDHARLPDWIGELKRLRSLIAGEQNLAYVPSSVGTLRRLGTLSLWRTLVAELPASIGDLHALEWLLVEGCRNLMTLPATVDGLWKLQHLDVSDSGLHGLPDGLGKLSQLRTLRINDNLLVTMPDWLLDLPRTQLFLHGNPLASPPPEIANEGTSAVLDFLAECREGASRQWLSKLLVVGEGGVGKTSAIKNLVGASFDPQESSTHGIRIFDHFVEHPHEPGVRMHLRTWDFGGQEIYHATHQFFLSDRSLFLLLWNNRFGWEQGRLRYWLDIIAARAPSSPVLLVATNAPVGGRPVDLPLEDLRREYPRIAGSMAVDNATGDGLDELAAAIRDLAIELPLMGATWPTSWLDAANAVDALTEQYVTPARLWRAMAAAGLENERFQRYVAGALHALGSILFHMGDGELGDTVILRPEWVNAYISRVLDSPDVEKCQGLLTRAHLDVLWEDLDRGLRDHFLGMMDRYDLSYRTGTERTATGYGSDVSLVVERLPWNAPEGYREKWERPRGGREGAPVEHEIRVSYQLNTTPPGIPTWFIARSHRFTTNTHWRTGAVLAHPDGRHRALIRGDRHRNVVELAVRGPSPAAFFAVLDEGLNLTLERYPGLDIRRLVPCPCEEGCTEMFDYDNLQRRLAQHPPRHEIECHRSGIDVHVPLLLLGIPPSERGEIRSALERLAKQGDAQHADLAARLDEQSADQQRMFLRLQRQIQSGLEAKCPSVFALVGTRHGKLGGAAYELTLYCEEPGAWHALPDGEGVYEFVETAAWIKKTAPYLRQLLTVLKHAAPLAGPVLGVTAEHLDTRLKADVTAMTALVGQLPEISAPTENLKALADRDSPSPAMERAGGEADFRALEQLLTRLDPERRWGGLSRVLTPEGLTLYLCPQHAAPYLTRPRPSAAASNH